MIHPSKRDAWIMLLLGLGVLVNLAVSAMILAQGMSLAWMAAILIVVAVWLVWIAMSTQYEIRPPELIVRCSFIAFHIPLDEIDQVYPTFNPLSAPALSLDRMCVHYRKNGKKRTMLISPQDKAAFLADLAEASPGLVVAGQSATRIRKA